MNQAAMLILFSLFMIALFILYTIASLVIPAYNAFLICLLIAVVFTITLKKMPIYEGLSHRTHFNRMIQNGNVTLQIPNYNTTFFTFSNYTLDGDADGTIYPS
jgi:hypothetical protein